MTKEQIDILNESIINIKTVCSMYAHCFDCPMKLNCSCLNPANWEEINNGKKETT